MTGKREERKLEHLKLAVAMESTMSQAGWEDLKLVHQALFKGDFSEINTETMLFGKKLSFPLIINALTGGATGLDEINGALARVAKENKIGMAVGSQTAGINNQEVRHTYEVVRKYNPDGLILANVSALVKPAVAKEAVAMIEADALQLHLNVVQEMLMAEGDRNFTGMAENIGRIVENAGVPVLAKEVGFGISKETALALYNQGIAAIDVGGTGGTNFAKIELARRDLQEECLTGWGIPTPISLLEVNSLGLPIPVIAAGGVKTPLEMFKAMALGAAAIGIAGPFLRILLQEGEDSLNRHIYRMREEFKMLMLAAGAREISGLNRIPIVILGTTHEWCEPRGINVQNYAKR